MQCQRNEMKSDMAIKATAFQYYYILIHTMRELDMAFQDINTANKLTSNRNPYYLCCRASIYSSQQEYVKAVEDLERASKIGANQDIEGLFHSSLHERPTFGFIAV